MTTVSDSSDAVGSPQSRRSTRNLPSPWSQVVRGSESEVVAAATPSLPFATVPPYLESATPDSNRSSAKLSTAVDCAVSEALPDSSDNDNGNAAAQAKRPVWNKLSNGVVEVGPVMGASWPALSESARASPKSSSDSLKALADGSGSATPVSTSQKSITNNTNPNPNPNHAFTTRQKSMKRVVGSANNGGPAVPPSVETAQSISDKPAAPSNSSPRDVDAPHHKNSNWENAPRGGVFGSQQPHIGNDQPRGSYRNRNGGGPHPRGGGDVPYHNSYGNRRDHDRGGYEWNPHQNISGRDVHMRPQRVGPRSFVRQPPPTAPPFISPPPVRPYPNPMGFPDLRSPLYYVPAPPPESVVPYVTHMPPPGMFLSAPDPQLRALLIKQIDYYFSSENLCKDIFLRQNMDEQGWVPISLIAGFNRVKQLTMHVPFILDAVRSSVVVEVQGDKIRKRNDWMNWLLPPPNQFGAAMPGPHSPNYETLVTRVQAIGLEGTSNHRSVRGPVDPHAEGVLSRSSSGDPNSQLQGGMATGISDGEGRGQNTVQMGSDQSMTSRSLETGDSC